MAARYMKLGFNLEGFGRTVNDWRHPDWERDAGTKFDYHLRQTLLAEQAKFDFVFLADLVFVTPETPPFFLIQAEAITLLSALAARTTHIGLVGTVSTTFSEPFNVARQFAMLDQISGGRSGWNIVTSFTDGSAQNFNGKELPPHEVRYQMAEEHLDVVQGLWDSWEDDALVQDKASGKFFEPGKLHILNHSGTYYKVKGPLNIPRSPQGQPVIFQAGMSENGRNFASRRSDCIFFNPNSFEEAHAFRADIVARAVKQGRDPDTVLLLPTTKAVVGSTEEEALRKYEARLDTLSLKNAYTILNRYFPDYDFSKHDPDAGFPREIFTQFQRGFRGSVNLIAETVIKDNLTLRQAAMKFGRPKPIWVGTPEQLADRMQEWFEGRAVDGFIFGQTVPGEFRLIAEQVIPILRKRGLVRADYDGTTFREHLGLPRPPNRFAAPAGKQPVRA